MQSEIPLAPGPRLGLTEDDIDAVVAAFYARIRVHPVLGPIFNHTVGTDAAIWRVHEAKIGRFWRNAILRQPVYDGNPMLAHAGVSAIRPEHFAIWLGLFDEVVADILQRDKAAGWSRLAHRIGRGLRLGLETTRARAGGVPDLTL